MFDDRENPQHSQSTSDIGKQIEHARACAEVDLELAKIFEELALEPAEPDAPTVEEIGATAEG